MKRHCHILFLITTEIQKLLTKLSKEKGMEALGRWRKACVRHFYWSVTSTKQSFSQSSLQSLNPFSTTYWTNTPIYLRGCSISVLMVWLPLNACGLQKVIDCLFCLQKLSTYMFINLFIWNGKPMECCMYLTGHWLLVVWSFSHVFFFWRRPKECWKHYYK